MTRLDETQMSQGFKGFTPENMLRLVRLAMPNVVRNKIFTEFAMETARDSIKYVRPVYSKTFNGNELVDKTEDWNRLYEDDAEDEYNDINSPNYRRPIYESLEDRISQELANIKSDGNGTFEFKGYKHFVGEIRVKPLARVHIPNVLIVTEPGDIYVGLGPESKVSGTAGNDTLQAWQQATEEINRKIKSLGGIINFAAEAGDKKSRDLFQHKRDSMYNAYVARTRRMAEEVESPLKEFMKSLYPEN